MLLYIMGNCTSRKKVWVKKPVKHHDDNENEDIILDNDDTKTYYDGSFFKPKYEMETLNIIDTDEIEHENIEDVLGMDIAMPDSLPLEETIWKNSMDTITEESNLELRIDDGDYDSASQSANDGEDPIPNRLAQFDSASMSPPRSKFRHWFYGDGKFMDFDWSLKNMISTSPSSDIVLSPSE